MEKLDGRVFCFDNIPVGSKIFAEAKIIFGEGHLQWTVIKGESKELTVESGENTLLLNLYQLAMCNIYNNTESVEPLSDIERISVYALPCDSSEATDILKLVAIDSELNDFRIKSKLESCKDMLVGDYYKDGDSELSQYFTGSYELKDGGEYYFLSLVYIKKGPVYLGHPAFEGTDPELAEKAVTKISFDEINYIYLSLMEMHLESEEVEIRFRFWDDEKQDYVKLEKFSDQTMTNDDDFDEEFDELAKTAVELGYTINEDKSGEIEYDEKDGKYVIYVYFDKDIIEELFSLKGTAADTAKYPGSFKFAIYSNLTYDITYNSDSIKDKIVSKGTISIPEDDSKLPSSIINFSITEKEYFAFKDMSSDVLETVKEPKEKTVDLTNGSFEFTGASGAVIKFTIMDEPKIVELELTDGEKEITTATLALGEIKKIKATLKYSDETTKDATISEVVSSNNNVVKAEVVDGAVALEGLAVSTDEEIVVKVYCKENPELTAVCKVTVEATSTSSGIEVNPAEIDTRDLADDFIVTSETDSDGSITLKAEPKTVENGYSYQWYVDGNAVNGATTMSYKWDPEMLRNLGSGVHYVMLQIEFTKDNEKEHYSVTKDSDGNDLILIVTSEE